MASSSPKFERSASLAPVPAINTLSACVLASQHRVVYDLPATFEQGDTPPSATDITDQEREADKLEAQAMRCVSAIRALSGDTD